MQELTGAEGSYESRCDRLVEYGIALWDVLAESVRPGSMDADILLETARPNDFTRFFSEHRSIERVCFNGQKAARLFQRSVVLDVADEQKLFTTLPSTSPAYASMKYDEKLARWHKAIT